MDSPTSPPPSPSILPPPASPGSPRVFEENSQALLEGDDDARHPLSLTQKGDKKREVDVMLGEEMTSSSPPPTDASDEDDPKRIPVTVKMYTRGAAADANGNTRQQNK